MDESVQPPGGMSGGLRDLAAMRAASAALLTDDAALPRHEEVQVELRELRGYLGQVVPAVEELAQALPDQHVTRASAMAATTQARAQLAAGPGCGLVSAVQHARGLARELRTLCRLHESLVDALTGQSIGHRARPLCVRCDRPIQSGEPYDTHIHHGASLAGCTTHRHVTCPEPGLVATAAPEAGPAGPDAPGEGEARG